MRVALAAGGDERPEDLDRLDGKPSALCPPTSDSASDFRFRFRFRDRQTEAKDKAVAAKPPGKSTGQARADPRSAAHSFHAARSALASS